MGNTIELKAQVVKNPVRFTKSERAEWARFVNVKGAMQAGFERFMQLRARLAEQATTSAEWEEWLHLEGLPAGELTPAERARKVELFVMAHPQCRMLAGAELDELVRQGKAERSTAIGQDLAGGKRVIVEEVRPLDPRVRSASTVFLDVKRWRAHVRTLAAGMSVAEAVDVAGVLPGHAELAAELLKKGWRAARPPRGAGRRRQVRRVQRARAASAS